MTVTEACEVIKATARPEFHGQIVLNIKDGGVSTLDVRTIYTEKPKPTAK